MNTYRVDYVTKCGQRGIWHSEAEREIKEIVTECKSEYSYISRKLKSDGYDLDKLVIVQITESDVQEIRP